MVGIAALNPGVVDGLSQWRDCRFVHGWPSCHIREPISVEDIFMGLTVMLDVTDHSFCCVGGVARCRSTKADFCGVDLSIVHGMDD